MMAHMDWESSPRRWMTHVTITSFRELSVRSSPTHIFKLVQLLHQHSATFTPNPYVISNPLLQILNQMNSVHSHLFVFLILNIYFKNYLII